MEDASYVRRRRVARFSTVADASTPRIRHYGLSQSIVRQPPTHSALDGSFQSSAAPGHDYPSVNWTSVPDDSVDGINMSYDMDSGKSRIPVGWKIGSRAWLRSSEVRYVPHAENGSVAIDFGEIARLEIYNEFSSPSTQTLHTLKLQCDDAFTRGKGSLSDELIGKCNRWAEDRLNSDMAALRRDMSHQIDLLRGSVDKNGVNVENLVQDRKVLADQLQRSDTAHKLSEDQLRNSVTELQQQLNKFVQQEGAVDQDLVAQIERLKTAVDSLRSSGVSTGAVRDATPTVDRKEILDEVGKSLKEATASLKNSVNANSESLKSLADSVRKLQGELDRHNEAMAAVRLLAERPVDPTLIIRMNEADYRVDALEKALRSLESRFHSQQYAPSSGSGSSGGDVSSIWKYLYRSDHGIYESDWALLSGGASVVYSHTSYQLAANKPPEAAFTPDMSQGSCFCFAGKSGDLTIRLPEAILPSGFTIDYPAKELTRNEGRSAPKDIEVYGWLSSVGSAMEPRLLSKTSVDTSGLQPYHYFTPSDRLNKAGVDVIRLHVVSNYDADFTCIYRFRVHGVSVRPK